MVKKRVPDWLNSSLWSSPQPQPPPQSSDAVESRDPPARAAEKSAVVESIVEQPVPVPPPPVTRPVEPPSSFVHSSSTSVKGENSDLLSCHNGSNYGNNNNHNYNSEEDNGSSSTNSTTASTASVGANAFAAASSLAIDISSQAQLLQELSRKIINMGELRRIASQGIPDGDGIRATLLLGYLPPDRALWPSELAKKRSQYKHFKEELLMNPSDITRKMEKSNLENNKPDGEDKGFLSRSEITHGEHPLSLVESSIWNQFFQETEIIEQIERDVKRTHPDMHFFSGDSAFAESNQEALKNILIVFAKLNPGIRYVQGMNEILAPLFYVLKNDPNEENAVSAEADTFFCFVELLSGFRDNFVKQLDNSVVGIRATITRLSQLLKEHDEELWRHLEITTKVNPQFYAFRWMTLLLTQEFNFADCLLIWDALLSDPDGPQDTLLRICCAMLVIVRRYLLASDFTSNLNLLQHYPSINICQLLYVADKLRIHGLG
ncbi:TBC1 domain family member 13 isoform X2 [Olea europaea var. sylvestris]|uniref:TBC1 domain family member 13 isoform X2 n=1 Tax=Olea europaea var. sylvestris TaxID=158386 RepID=UPI000C1D1EAA|nr:TBC1 domain family member 13 isoform X2 [Olea europaea var. sylvestris]